MSIKEIRKRLHAELVEDVKVQAANIIREQPNHNFGWGFLWGYINYSKTLICCIDGRANHDEIISRVMEIESVTGVYINLD